jgi:hypothetical protein
VQPGPGRQGYSGDDLPKKIQNWLKKTFSKIKFDFKDSRSKYGFTQKGNEAKHKSIQTAAKKKMKDPDYTYVYDVDIEKAKYDKGWGTPKQLLKKAKEKGINISEKRKFGSEFAKSFNIKSKVNPYHGGSYIYDLTVLDNPKKVETIIKKQFGTGHGTIAAKEKYLSKEAQQIAARIRADKRKKAIEKFSVKSIERGYQGTPKVHLSHMDDIFSQYTTGYTLGYTPGKINVEFLEKGGYDYKFRALYKQREKLKKNKPEGYIKKLEEINLKGARLAGETQGYKSFRFEDPYTGKSYQFGVDAAKTIDPTGILQGRKLQDIVKSGNPFDPNSKLVLDLSPQDSYIFEKNRKAVLASQKKVAPVKKIKELKSKIIEQEFTPESRLKGRKIIVASTLNKFLEAKGVDMCDV